MKAMPSSILITAVLSAGFSASAADSTPVYASPQQTTAKSDEAESLARLRREKAALEKRLQEINAEIGRIWAARGVKCLGMTLVDSSVQTAEQYGLRKESPLPIIIEVQDPSFFPAGMRPYEGCAFLVVEHPANGFLFNQERAASFRPKTVRELIVAILACTATPDEYRKLWKRAEQAARDRANALKDNSDERQRLLKLADTKMPSEDAGKYICRVVYNYPHDAGTMPTWIHMTKKDLEQLREMLKR